MIKKKPGKTGFFLILKLTKVNFPTMIETASFAGAKGVHKRSEISLLDKPRIPKVN